MITDFWNWVARIPTLAPLPCDLCEDNRRDIDPSVLRSYDHAFRQALEQLIARTHDPALRRTFEGMRDCPLRDRRGHCRGWAEYIVAALVKGGVHQRFDLEAALNYVAERLLMSRSYETGQRRVTVFDDFDESRPYAPGDNPLQARFMSWLAWAVSSIRRGNIKRLANVEERPRGTLSIVPGRVRRGEQPGGVSADEIGARAAHDAAYGELVDDLTRLLARQERSAGLPLVDLFREMLAGMRTQELRRVFGDRRAREGREVVLRTIGDYAQVTGNLHLSALLDRFTAPQEPRERRAASPAKPLLPEKERDYRSIASVVARFQRPVGTADLGKYRRRWLDYPPRNAGGGYKNRLEEVLAAMVREGVLRATKTRGNALVYSPGPGFDAYRQEAPA